MVTFLESAGRGVKNLFCSALKNGSNFAGLFPSGLGADTIQSSLEGAYGNTCSPNPAFPPQILTPPPYEGGQCPVTYNWQVSFSFTTSGGAVGNRTFSRVINGPTLPSLAANYAQVNATQWAVKSGDGFIWGGEQYPLSSTFNGITFFGAAGWRPLNTTGAFQPMSTLTGDCSTQDLPSSLPTPIDEFSDEIDIDYTDDDGNPVSIPSVPIKLFEPCINLDGIRVPFELDTPFGKLCGKLGISGDIPNIVEPSIDIDLCPSQKEDLGLNTPELEDYFEVSNPIGTSVSSEFDGVLNEDFDLEQLPIMGVFVNSQYVEKPLSQTVLDQLGTKPNLIIPNIGYVIFQYLVPTSETTYESAFSAEIPVKITNQFIPCPYPFGAVGVQVRWSSNWEGNYRLAKRKSCCKNCSEGSAQEIVDKLDRCRLD